MTHGQHVKSHKRKRIDFHNIKLRDILLPLSPNIGNSLYKESDQLNSTAQFYMLAMSQRAKVQVHAGSKPITI